ncbi:HNH endonuclease signature motif containing protein [Azospirillum sp. TSH64]|uniref:HNH endonuclease n=1 Tax=Azospirillum sp. TSH64 TaxID=652740 RepID=UPI000D65B069|nr:HNH endonuclease signature motif containing protein [Azospirillum sp. TSH64]
MAVWWVNVGQEYKSQREAGVLWCPNKTRRKDGSLTEPQWHWEMMASVKVGEVIVCCRKNLITGLCVAKETAIPNSEKPLGLDAQHKKWHEIGWKLPVEFIDAKPALDRKDTLSGITLPKEHRGPFSSRGLNQVYFCQIPVSVASKIVEAISANIQGVSGIGLETLVARSVPDKTTRTAVVEARVGQGQFRSDLMKIWSGKCCATGTSRPEMLRASHIVPWSECDNADRINPYNGLLLNPSYDAAFDKNLITLDDNGNWLVSPDLTPEECRRAGLGNPKDHSVSGLTEKHREYLRSKKKKCTWVSTEGSTSSQK